MRPVVIRVEEPTSASGGAQGYPVKLFADEDNDSAWLDEPLAVGLIPHDLYAPGNTLGLTAGGADNADAIRQRFVNDAGPSDVFREIGAHLGGLLFGGIGDEWQRLKLQFPGEKQGGTEGRRIFLDVMTAKLRTLPWELLFEPDGQFPLALDLRNPFLRGSPLPLRPAPPPFAWPLNVLVVVGTPRAEVRAKEEVEAIRSELRRVERPVEPEVLWYPSQTQLVEMLRDFKPHVLHFIGHGGEGTGGNKGSSVLFFDNKLGQPVWEWTTADIFIDLQHWTPHIACLNACRTAYLTAQQFTPARQEKVLGITEAFIRAGVPAVIGMQADVRSAAAERLPGELFRALVNGRPLDGALARARDDVRLDKEVGLRRRDWAAAALHAHGAPEKTLLVGQEAADEVCDLMSGVAEFGTVKRFVDRVGPRRTLSRGVADAPDKNLLVVEGGQGVGKTWLVYWCFKLCAWRRHDIRYVNLEKLVPGGGGQERLTKNYLDVLRAVQHGGGGEGHLYRPLPQDVFGSFDEAVADTLAEAAELYARDRGRPAPADENALLQYVSADRMRDLFILFREALRKAADGKPLVIAIDRLHVAEGYFKNFITPWLLHHVATGKLAPVKMILIADTDRNTDLGLTSLEGNVERISLPPLTSTLLEEFADEFFKYHEVNTELAEVLTRNMKENSETALRPITPVDFWGVLESVRHTLR